MINQSIIIGKKYLKVKHKWKLDTYGMKIFNIKRWVRIRLFEMIREQLSPCIIPHHHYSLSILNQLQMGKKGKIIYH